MKPAIPRGTEMSRATERTPLGLIGVFFLAILAGSALVFRDFHDAHLRDKAQQAAKAQHEAEARTAARKARQARKASADAASSFPDRQPQLERQVAAADAKLKSKDWEGARQALKDVQEALVPLLQSDIAAAPAVVALKKAADRYTDALFDHDIDVNRARIFCTSQTGDDPLRAWWFAHTLRDVAHQDCQRLLQVKFFGGAKNEWGVWCWPTNQNQMFDSPYTFRFDEHGALTEATCPSTGNGCFR
jgi:hypothetical protein